MSFRVSYPVNIHVDNHRTSFKEFYKYTDSDSVYYLLNDKEYLLVDIYPIKLNMIDYDSHNYVMHLEYNTVIYYCYSNNILGEYLGSRVDNVVNYTTFIIDGRNYYSSKSMLYEIPNYLFFNKLGNTLDCNINHVICSGKGHTNYVYLTDFKKVIPIRYTTDQLRTSKKYNIFVVQNNNMYDIYDMNSADYICSTKLYLSYDGYFENSSNLEYIFCKDRKYMILRYINYDNSKPKYSLGINVSVKVNRI